MSALTRMAAKISTTEMLEANDPLDVLREASTTVALGPMSIEVQPGVSNQELRMFGAQGLLAVKSFVITSDASITVSYEGTAPVPLVAGGFHAMSGTSISTITVTNATADIAHLTMWLAGVEPTLPLGAGTYTLTGIDVTLTADIATTCTAISSGLVACWDMDELTGTRVDHIGGNNVTMSGTVPGVTGKVRKAAQFNGTGGNYLHGVNNFYDLGHFAFTMAIWVKLTSIPAATQLIVSYGSTTSAGQYNFVVLALGTTGRIELSFQGGGAGVLLSSSNLVVGNWTLLLIWHDGAHLFLQQNNGTIDSVVAAFASLGAAAGTFDFGAIGGGNDPLFGLVDSTQIWNRVLSVGERSTVWNGGAGI